MIRPRFRKPVLVATIVLCLVALLAALRPPTPAFPYFKIKPTDSVQLEGLLAARPTIAACRNALAEVIAQSCGRDLVCVAQESACLTSLGERLLKFQGNEPLDQPSLRFSDVDMLIDADSPERAMGVCASVEQQVGGRCYAAGKARETLAGDSRLPGFFAVPTVSLEGLLKLLVTAFAFSLAAMIVILMSQRWHGAYTFDRAAGIQKFHAKPVPRIGGVGIAFGLVISSVFMPVFGLNFFSTLAWQLIGAASIVFFFGVLEDVTARVGVSTRFLATLASGVLAWWLLGVSLQSVGIEPIDAALGIAVVSVAFTAFAMAGLTNAINIIDGFHGLAAGSVIGLLAIFGALAIQVGDLRLAVFCGLVVATTLGFFVVNYPFGKLFLGDGGAYLLGFLLAAIAVLLPERNPNVSPWASLLICAYPVAETLFSIVRRMKAGLGIGNPDRAHLHSLIKLGLVKPNTVGKSPDFQNALVAPPLWCLALLPGVFTLAFYKNSGVLIGLFLGFLVLYWLAYEYCRRCALAHAGHSPGQHQPGAGAV